MERFEMPNGYYRVSIKGLILDETGKKFATLLEGNGWWELPGGGMDFGETPAGCLKREVKEETGLEVTYVAPQPSYILVGKNMKERWSVNMVYEIKVKDLNFTRTEECQEIKFISPEEIDTINAFRNVKELAKVFDTKKHSVIL